MRGPVGAVLTSTLASLLATGLLVSVSSAATATARTDADTTPPRVQLDPCPEVPHGEACSRREVAAVWEERVDPEEGLAVAGVRIGDTVLSEHVYDDGTGFTPYGYWLPPQTDAVSAYDYVTEAWLDGPGRHELTFYARDLAGNEATFTRTVEGPMVPDRPFAFDVVVRPAEQGWTTVSWRVDARGSGIRHFLVRVKGQEPTEEPSRTFAPHYGVQDAFVDLVLRPGRHVLRVVPVNGVGKGLAGRVVFHVPRR